MKGYEIIIFDTDQPNVEMLRERLNLPYVRFIIGNGLQATAAADIDAMWLTLMQAERYGSSPPFPLHSAQILVTPEAEVAKGFPRFVITGGATLPSDPQDLEWQLWLIVTVMTTAIKAAQEQGTSDIQRVGMLPDHLMLHKLPVEVAGSIIDAAYREQYQDSAV